MGKRLLGAGVLVLFSLGVLLFPWGGFYRSPFLWADYGTGEDKPVDVFLVGATADHGLDGTYQSSCFLKDDRYFQASLLNMQAGLYSDVCRVYAPYYRQACLSVYYLPDAERGPIFRWLTGMYGRHFYGIWSTRIRDGPLFWRGIPRGRTWLCG